MSEMYGKYQKIVQEIYREIYKRAKPKGDWNKMLKSGEAKMPNFFAKYYLDEHIQQVIITEICKKHKLTRREIDAIRTEVTLGSSPIGAVKDGK